MSASATLDPHAEAADYIARLIDQDPRHQKIIAAAAGISEGHITHLKKGDRTFTIPMARRLGRAFPEHASEMRELAEAIDDAGTLPRTLPGLLDRLMSGLAPTFA